MNCEDDYKDWVAISFMPKIENDDKSFPAFNIRIRSNKNQVQLFEEEIQGKKEELFDTFIGPIDSWLYLDNELSISQNYGNELQNKIMEPYTNNRNKNTFYKSMMKNVTDWDKEMDNLKTKFKDFYNFFIENYSDQKQFAKYKEKLDGMSIQISSQITKQCQLEI